MQPMVAKDADTIAKLKEKQRDSMQVDSADSIFHDLVHAAWA
jgi:hypothetical protein